MPWDCLFKFALHPLKKAHGVCLLLQSHYSYSFAHVSQDCEPCRSLLQQCMSNKFCELEDADVLYDAIYSVCCFHIKGNTHLWETLHCLEILFFCLLMSQLGRNRIPTFHLETRRCTHLITSIDSTDNHRNFDSFEEYFIKQCAYYCWSIGCNHIREEKIV